KAVPQWDGVSFMLPDFDADGSLPNGVWECTGDEFRQRFLTNKHRREYDGVILNILDFAAHYGAISVLVGGSFVTEKVDPQDFDCVILFNSRVKYHQKSRAWTYREIPLTFSLHLLTNLILLRASSDFFLRAGSMKRS